MNRYLSTLVTPVLVNTYHLSGVCQQLLARRLLNIGVSWFCRGYCMDTGSLAVNNMFVPSTGPASPRPAATKNTKQFAQATLDNPHTVNAQEKTTTDNTAINAQNEPTSQQTQDFSYTLGEKTATQTPREPQDNTKSQEQSPTSAATTQPNSADSHSAQDSLDVATGKDEDATKVLVKPEVMNKSAQLLADLIVSKSNLAAGQTAKPAPTKLGQIVPATSQHNTAPKRSAAEGLFGAGQSAVDQSKIGLKTVLPNAPKEPLTTNNRSGGGENIDKTPASNEIVTATKAHSSRESSEELTAEVLNNGSKTTIAGKKPATGGNSAAQGSQKTAQLSGKELTPEASSAAEKPHTADKPVVSGDQKAPILNDNFTAVQEKPSDSQSRLVGIGSEKSAPVAEKPTNSKADANQHSSALSESSHDNGTKQGTAPSGEPLFKDLNLQQLQISTQAKDRSNSTSNNSSDSDAGHTEQMLSTSNVQTPITEQSSASPQAPKPAGNASSSDVFTGVNEQIQESIYTSLRRGDQQITIRLNPPELGKVIIKFQEQQDQITGLLQVSNAQTRAEIQQALPQIIQNLADSGIQIKRLEVVLTEDHSEQQLLKDQLLQDGWSGRNGSAEDNNYNPDNIGTNEWLTNANGYQRIDEPQEMLVTNNSINMLM